MSVAHAWDRPAVRSAYPTRYFRANPGASPEAIDALEREIGSPLPGDFRESLLVHDGGFDLWLLPTHGELWPVPDILSNWTRYLEGQRTGGYADPRGGGWAASAIRGPIKPYFWSPKRLYVTDNSADHVTLDLDPPEDGRYGQVLYHRHEVGPEQVLAPSWSAYLELVAGELESGKYCYAEEEECVLEEGTEA